MKIPERRDEAPDEDSAEDGAIGRTMEELLHLVIEGLAPRGGHRRVRPLRSVSVDFQNVGRVHQAGDADPLHVVSIWMYVFGSGGIKIDQAVHARIRHGFQFFSLNASDRIW